MINNELSQVIYHWKYIAPIICYPKSEKEYYKLIQRMDELLNIVGNDENHPLIDLLDVVSHFIEEYEAEHYHEEQNKPTGIDALKFLMETHHLHQSDLSEIGSQGVISEILNGKRKLNLRQIKLLAERFDVDPSTFM